ncbi:MAG: carnitine dehydratase, partial [Sphingomonadaceae bacterium]|nr:carnitine dehydratase [Sphingomonadaceae bacterium]
GVELEIASLEGELGVRFADGDTPRFTHRKRLFDLFQHAAGQRDYGDLEAAMAQQGCTFERYRTMYEAANDPVLVGSNPLFGPSPANPSGFEYPATRSFAKRHGHVAGDPAPAPYLGQHSEEVLADRLGLSSGAIAKLVDAGTVALSDKD